MRLGGHGLHVDLPRGWEARIWRHPGGAPTLHAASFALPTHDGDFGSRATAEMHPGDSLLVLTEYQPGGGLRAGRGLFAPRQPSRLEVGDFRAHALAVARPGQVGCQRFFTAQGRALCLYAVLHLPTGAVASAVAGQTGALNGVLGSVAVELGRSGSARASGHGDGL